MTLDTPLTDANISSASNWNTAYTDRLKWDGGSTGLTPATGRTSLELGSMALLADTGGASITTLGTIGTGVWQGTAIGDSFITQTLTNKTLTNPTIKTRPIFSTNEFNATTTVAQYDIVQLVDGSGWRLANATTSAASNGMLAMALEAGTAGNALNVALPNSFVTNSSWAWTPGDTLYVSATTAGGTTSSFSTTTDNVIRVVGFAITTTTIHWYPSPDYITHN